MLGFSLIHRGPQPDLQGQNEFIRTLESQAASQRIPREKAADQLVMSLDLR
jgi:hypothetical protein